MRAAWRSLRLAHQSTAFSFLNLRIWCLCRPSDNSLRYYKIKSIINQSMISNNEEKMFSKLEKMDNSAQMDKYTHTKNIAKKSIHKCGTNRGKFRIS